MTKARDLAKLGGVVNSSGEVPTAGIANSAVTTDKIAANAVVTADIADGAVTTEKIAAGAVATVDIADSAVTTAKIADSAITSGKIADGAVATADIADSAVTTAKIANANVTVAKISATGTPSSTTFLRGDGSWQEASSIPTYGAVGTYINAFYGINNTNSLNQGRTLAGGTDIAGSSLYISQYSTTTSVASARVWNPGTSVQQYNNATFSTSGLTALTGTWRVMQPSMYTNRTDAGCGNNFYTWYSIMLVRVA
jgi:hypothetical protein